MNLTISLIYGSLRSDRQGIQVARFLEQKLKEIDINMYFIDSLENKLSIRFGLDSEIGL